MEGGQRYLFLRFQSPIMFQNKNIGVVSLIVLLSTETVPDI